MSFCSVVSVVLQETVAKWFAEACLHVLVAAVEGMMVMISWLSITREMSDE